MPFSEIHPPPPEACDELDSTVFDPAFGGSADFDELSRIELAEVRLPSV
jgi:hypothetical protein